MAILLELAQDLEQVVLGVVDQHQPPRSDPRDLPAQLRADRPASSRDEYDLTRKVCPHALELHPNRLTAEHVLDLHLAQLSGHSEMTRAVSQQLEDGGHRADRNSAPATASNNSRAQRAR